MSCREGKPESARPKGTDKVWDKLCRPRSIGASTKRIRGGQKPPQTSGCHPGCHLRDPSGGRERKRGAAGTAFGDGPPAVILSLGLPCVSGATASGAWALHLHVACHPCGLPSPLLLPHGLAGITTRVVCGNTPGVWADVLLLVSSGASVTSSVRRQRCLLTPSSPIVLFRTLQKP